MRRTKGAAQFLGFLSPPVVDTKANNGDADISSTCANLRSANLGLKVRKQKKAENPDFLILRMIQMRSEAEERAHNYREKVIGRK